MRKVTYQCDICKNAVASTHFRVETGCEMDPSGNGYNTSYDYYDVCLGCLGTFHTQHPKSHKVSPEASYGY